MSTKADEQDLGGSRPKLIDWLLGVALTISSVAILLLALRMWIGPSDPNQYWRPPVSTSRADPALLVETLNADTVALLQPGKRGIVVAYITSCQYCEASIEAWKVVLSRVCDLQFTFVSPEPVRLQEAYWSSRPLASDHCVKPIIGKILNPQSFRTAFNLRGTPNHFLVSQHGQIESNWRGALHMKDVKRFLRELE
ncbi:MAG: hypothetical protein WEE89_13965 [Gemmatimonadota bacterium]